MYYFQHPIPKKNSFLTNIKEGAAISVFPTYLYINLDEYKHNSIAKELTGVNLYLNLTPWPAIDFMINLGNSALLINTEKGNDTLTTLPDMPR